MSAGGPSEPGLPAFELALRHMECIIDVCTHPGRVCCALRTFIASEGIFGRITAKLDIMLMPGARGLNIVDLTPLR